MEMRLLKIISISVVIGLLILGCGYKTNPIYIDTEKTK
jgi:hypothetical protein